MKRIISIIASLALIMLSLPMAFAAEPTVVHDLSSVSGLGEKLKSSENITYGFSDTTIGKDSSFSATYGSVSNPKNVGINKTQTGASSSPTNGIIDEDHLDFSYRFLPSAGTYATTPLDITFTFFGTAKMDAFLLAGTCETTQTTMYTQEFAIFASDSLASLYTDANKVYHYTRGTDNYNDFYITFPETVSGKYIGLRVYKGVTQDMSQINYSYFRAREIAIFGEAEDPEGFEALNPTNIATAISELQSDYNLIGDDYYLSYDNAPGSITLSGYDGSKYIESGSATSYDSDFDIIDGKVGNHADIRVGNILYRDSAMKEVKGVYTDVTANLRFSSTIDKLFVSLSPTPGLRAEEYFVYASSSRATLYNEENKIASFSNPNNSQNQAFVFDEPISAQYIGIRITMGVAASYNFGYTNSYARLAEFAVFGEYDTDYYTYELSSNADSVADSGRVYSGYKKTFTAPLVVNEKTFDGWLVNGEEYDDYIIDEYADISELTLEINENTTIYASYSYEVNSLTTSVLKITDDNRVLADNLIVYAVKDSFDQYRSLIKVKTSEGQEKADGQYLETGDVITLHKHNTDFDFLNVTEVFDFNLEGGLTVTDLIAATDGILKNALAEHHYFVFDADENGKLTVSDVIAARNKLLNPEKTDYSSRTVAMKNLVYKPLGRTEVKEDKLVLEMTSAGLAFTADCYGDVSLNFTQGAGDIYYTIILDGERIEDIKVIKNKTDNYVIAKNLPAGEHTFEIMKQEEATTISKVNSVSLIGEIGDRPEDKELYVEFVGDSITCGYGNLLPKGAVPGGSTKHQDGTLAYSTQTAFMLDADYGIISRSASSLIDDGASRAHMPTEYEKVSLSSSTPWSFERKADIVVINLATNDNGIIGKYAGGSTHEKKRDYFKGLAYDFAKRIIELNGDDVEIVFAIGIMSPGNIHDWAKEAYRETAAKLQSEGYDAYFCDLPYGQSGGGKDPHPTVEEGIAAAEVLTAFINETVLKD